MKVKLNTVHADITPYALATLSDSFCETGKSASENVHNLVRYFIYCRSIELGLKACILNNNCTKENKDLLSSKKIGHDLLKAKKLAEQTLGVELFTPEQNETMVLVNESYKKKGIEYFTVNMVAEAMKGFKKLPDIEKLADTAKSLNVFLHKNKFFINSQTKRSSTEKESGGLINLY